MKAEVFAIKKIKHEFLVKLNDLIPRYPRLTDALKSGKYSYHFVLNIPEYLKPCIKKKSLHQDPRVQDTRPNSKGRAIQHVRVMNPNIHESFPKSLKTKHQLLT